MKVELYMKNFSSVDEKLVRKLLSVPYETDPYHDTGYSIRGWGWGWGSGQPCQLVF